MDFSLERLALIVSTASRFTGALCCTAILYGTVSLTCAQNPPPGVRAKPSIAAPNLAEAGKTFAGICAGCHGLDGLGSERGPNIASRQEVVRRSDGQLLKTLRNGISESGMPNFAFLGDPKLEALVKYLRALQGKSARMPIPGDAKHGEALFFAAARCSECHALNGKGGFLGSDLSLYAADASPDEVRSAIVKPNRDGKPSVGLTHVTLANGKTFDGIVRNEDNFSLQLQSVDGAFHFVPKAEVATIKPSDQSLMPDNYGQTLSAAELDDIVGYLMRVGRSSSEKDAKKQKHTDD